MLSPLSFLLKGKCKLKFKNEMKLKILKEGEIKLHKTQTYIYIYIYLSFCSSFSLVLLGNLKVQLSSIVLPGK
jgi:hypothetical protein